MIEKQVEDNLRKIAYSYADACVSKALAKLRKHPERSKTPYKSFTFEFLRDRLLEEIEEYTESNDYRELLDVGNFACWLWWGDYTKEASN